MFRLLRRSAASGCPPQVGMVAMLMRVSARLLSVLSADTPNPQCLRFYSMEASFLPPGHNMGFPDRTHSSKSPLAHLLFSLEGLRCVHFGDEYITVTKEEAADWSHLEPMVKDAITAFLESKKNILSDEGEKLLRPADEDTQPSEDDDEVILSIKELIAQRIRPMLRADGGNLRFVGFDNGTVFVILEGACKRCPGSSSTLKFGIERMLMHWIPEVLEVVEVDEDFAEEFAQSQLKLKKTVEELEGAKEEESGRGAPLQQPDP